MPINLNIGEGVVGDLEQRSSAVGDKENSLQSSPPVIITMLASDPRPLSAKLGFYIQDIYSSRAKSTNNTKT